MILEKNYLQVTVTFMFFILIFFILFGCVFHTPLFKNWMGWGKNLPPRLIMAHFLKKDIDQSKTSKSPASCFAQQLLHMATNSVSHLLSGSGHAQFSCERMAVH